MIDFSSHLILFLPSLTLCPPYSFFDFFSFFLSCPKMFSFGWKTTSDLLSVVGERGTVLGVALLWYSLALLLTDKEKESENELSKTLDTRKDNINDPTHAQTQHPDYFPPKANLG